MNEVQNDRKSLNTGRRARSILFYIFCYALIIVALTPVAFVIFLYQFSWAPITIFLVPPLIWVTYYLRKNKSSSIPLIKFLNCDHGALLALIIILILGFGLFGFTPLTFRVLAWVGIALSLFSAIFSLVMVKGPFQMHAVQLITIFSVPLVSMFLQAAVPAYELWPHVGKKWVPPNIDASIEDFFNLRYTATKGAECVIRGNLNQIRITNIGRQVLVVDEINLRMTHSGRNITASDAPKVYRGHAIYTDSTPIVSGPDFRMGNLTISPSQSLIYAFPFSDCNGLIRYPGEDIEYNYSVAMRAGDKRYRNTAQFTKQIKGVYSFAYRNPEVRSAKKIEKIINSALEPGDSKEKIDTVIANIENFKCGFSEIARRYRCSTHETGLGSYSIYAEIFVDDQGRFLSVTSKGSRILP